IVTVEVRAIVYPASGVPQVLDPIYLLANPTGAKTFYIANDGDDSTGDGTIGNPWKTPVYAMNYWERAGNTAGINGAIIYHSAGTYTIGSDFAHTHQPTT